MRWSTSRRRALTTLGAGLGMLFLSCSGDGDCAAGNPLMPQCESITRSPPPSEPHVVFSSDRDGNWEIYSMNSDGTGVTRLTDNPAADIAPRWSPDGRQIAFHSGRDGNFEIYVMNADGSGSRNLTNRPSQESFAHWSPDGTRILFQSDIDGNFEIYVVNSDGAASLALLSIRLSMAIPDGPLMAGA